MHFQTTLIPFLLVGLIGAATDFTYTTTLSGHGTYTVAVEYIDENPAYDLGEIADDLAFRYQAYTAFGPLDGAEYITDNYTIHGTHDPTNVRAAVERAPGEFFPVLLVDNFIRLMGRGGVPFNRRSGFRATFLQGLHEIGRFTQGPGPIPVQTRDAVRVEQVGGFAVCLVGLIVSGVCGG